MDATARRNPKDHYAERKESNSKAPYLGLHLDDILEKG